MAAHESVTELLRGLNATKPFSSGIPSLDQRKLGPARKELHLLMAMSGRGKTCVG